MTQENESGNRVNYAASGHDHPPDNGVPTAWSAGQGASADHVDGLLNDIEPRQAEQAERDHEDPWSPENTIEYWVWNGQRLLPALPEQVIAFREREALQRLERLKRSQPAPAPPGVGRARSVLTRRMKRWWSGLRRRHAPAGECGSSDTEVEVSTLYGQHTP